MSPLANLVYRRLFAAQVIALAGTGMSTIALSLLAHDLVGGRAGLVLGTALAIKMVAYVSLAPVFGAYAPLLPRRALLVSLDLARAACIALMPFVTEIWQIYALIFLLNACSAGFTPVFQATIPDILPDEGQYTRALSLSRLAHDLENLISPLAASAALVWMSYSGLFAINATTFVISAMLVLSVALPAQVVGERAAGIWAATTAGIRAYVATPRLRALLALSFAVAAAGSMVIVNTVVFVISGFGGAERDVALAFAAFGAGSMVVALGLPALLDRRPDRPFMLAGGGLLTAGLVVGVWIDGLVMLAAVWCVLGAGTSAVLTPAGRLLRRSAHQGNRPAIFAAQFALSHGCWLICYPLAGWLGATVSLATATSVMAALAALSTFIAWRAWPAGMSRELEHEHAAFDHEHVHVHDEHHQHQHEGWEGPEPHSHPHRHASVRHSHVYVIDSHHPVWPRG